MNPTVSRISGTAQTFRKRKPSKNITMKKSNSSEKIESLKASKSKEKSPKMSKRYNEGFIKILGELEEIMKRKGEGFRARAYHNAQEAIMAFKDDIIESKQLNGVQNIGPTIIEKLDEFIKTGTLKAIEKERDNPLHVIGKVYGIGPKKANDLIALKITTIDQLRENQDKLTAASKLGLKHFEDIEKRIPREEIFEFDKKFSKIFTSVAPSGSNFEIVGSYRRGAKDSGDVDIIISNKDNDKKVYDKVIEQLIEDKIIIGMLAHGKTKSMGLAQLKDGGPIRRIDILYSTPEEYPFAILYFTGSKMFNVAVRQHALNKRYTLNEHGLSHITSGVKGDKIDNTFTDETSILNFLGIEYREPEDRIDGNSIILINKDKSTSASESASTKIETITLPKSAKNKTMKKTPSKE